MRNFMSAKIKHKVQSDIQLIKEYATVLGPFDEVIEILAENGYEIVSLLQNVRLIQSKKNSFVLSYYPEESNWTREGIIYFPDGKSKLVRNSPVLFSAIEATHAHKNNKEF